MKAASRFHLPRSFYSNIIYSLIAVLIVSAVLRK